METDTRTRRRELGRRMRAAARDAGLDSTQIARRLGVGSSTVRHWWSGNTEIPAGRLAAYADLVSRPVAVLLGDAAADALYRAGQRDLLNELLGGGGFAAVVERLSHGVPFSAGRLAGLEADVTLLRAAVERHTGRRWAALSPSEREEVLRALLEQLNQGDGNGAHPPPRSLIGGLV